MSSTNVSVLEDWRTWAYTTPFAAPIMTATAVVIATLIPTMVYILWIIVCKPYRNRRDRHPFLSYFYRLEQGVFKPHPLPALFALQTICMVERLCFIIMALSGRFQPGRDVIIMEMAQEIGWSFFMSGYVLYFAGIFYASPLPHNTEHHWNKYMPSGKVINVVIATICGTQFVFGLTAAAMTGYLYENGNNEAAEILISVRYWGMWYVIGNSTSAQSSHSSSQVSYA
ncbi:hypothetical protein BJ742DRAFT_776270 [Cladochytrium replicatum]|nr:hypothetical protein BJ742DRAFT_776270 [Cladochytrium replicatum]